MWGRARKRAERAERLLSTRVAVDIGGLTVVGPATLESLALMIRFGGYDEGEDLLQDSLAANWGRARISVRVWPG